eukprot:CAMPEP_0114431110 /NCGR_PEP_ID=MMETSP0103-20121206/10418_1 /TAXON_ID=37642 ORGANISM="Paraphysomonas imperforata, Strain PA2" /NCGR_SAMPLE_ID=MMETSP0103 /ASSEMBLY_ACC=CAM_ASM_000201 /LENGTH=513 /DNA_ID=CAMNT_0001600639 /DNA_START=37 /DNA_END=1578 /DNA_ORIENTATION=-
MASEESDEEYEAYKLQKNTAYNEQTLSVVVLGASGDLAKKKTYPALYDLFSHGYLPKTCVNIVGYARSASTDAAFRDKIKAFLPADDPDMVTRFLSICCYFQGQYGSEESFSQLNTFLLEKESVVCSANGVNRLFYFAIPPNVFIPSARAIDAACRSTGGWNRIVVEKPFGHDLESALQMSSELTSLWDEDDIYRIDHYLGKEIVQNLIVFRFGNMFLEPLMNNRYVQSIKITFKENFGTQGRGGYFDNYGIIRDIMQNHLMQVLTLVAMEAPVKVAGDGYANLVRDAKVNVLKSMSVISADDVVVGQYVANDKGDEGYLDDPTVPRGSKTPTFAQAHLKIHTPRWDGVPFIMKAGKALDERKAEIRIQFKEVPGSHFMFAGQHAHRNELVMRLQPDQSVYFKVNVKEPGLFSKMVQSELDLSYNQRYKEVYAPDAYTRLLLDTLRGSQATFVRSDELEGSWRIFDPLLKELEARGDTPEPYVYGSRGPASADIMAEELGVKRNEEYEYKVSK